MHRLLAGCLAALALLLTGLAAQADERIHRFQSDIEVAADGTLTVTETITVRAEGDQIKRGIFRDIPLTAEGPDGRLYDVGFDLVSVQQDGRPAPHFTRRNSGGVRIYVGEEGVFLRPGDYTYTITYETDRQVRFFDNHDEIYWNVTGNEWAFPIDEAVARVVLSEGVTAKDWTAFTGGYGQSGTDFQARTAEGGREVIFTTTRTLRPHEGLTVVVNLPKGAVAPPSEGQQLRYFLSDYLSELIGGAGIALALFYYLLVWWKVGRDPDGGVVFPRFKAPEGVSPALARYITGHGFGDGGWVALSAACLNLAVKKRLRLQDDDGEVTLVLQRDGQDDRIPGFGLPNGEAAVEKYLNGRNNALTLSKKNGTSVQTLGSKFRGAIEKESRNVFFRTNRAYLIPGVALSIITIAALFIFGRMSPDQEGFVFLFLVFSVFASVLSVSLGKIAFRFASLQTRMAVIFCFFAVAIAAVGFGAFQVSGGVDTVPALPVIAVVLVAMNILFFFLIGAPTALGRKVMDEIEGLRLYLSVAEKERLNMAAPDMSTKHFEALLPYAVALGVERPWAKAFEGWLATAAGAAAAASYHPDWYSGRAFDARHISDSVGATASSMAGSFRSSLPAPKSSSSGSSGGFSGGGGGGGGGGGW
ncbi:DUF2207 domain-containing protein [Roseibium salinum]|uniref:DUF2207 domain-containing protein n=1 Tax=Roseibium salinum TaxID=1604349 RepID=UPI0035F0A097